MRRTKEQAEQTRTAILAAAELLFLEKGVAHSTLEQIAKAAGVTRGAVYWHFENKAHLFHELLSQVRLPPEQLTERLCDPAAGDPLLSLDRLTGNELNMTQELIANMLGVRREGVTEAALKLQRLGLIRYSRGHITVLDRAALEARTCECYAVVRKEYERLLPDRAAS